MQMWKQDRQELGVYALLWGVLFMAPIVGHYVSVDQDGYLVFGWHDVIHVWKELALIFVVFLIHNFLLAPLFIQRQRRWLYFSLVAVLVAAFVVVQCAGRPRKDMRHDTMGHRPPMEHFDDMHEPDDMPKPDGRFAPDDMPKPDGRFAPDDMPKPDGRFAPDGMHGPDDKQVHPPFVFGQHDVVAVIILLLMLGLNLGVKLYFQQRGDRKRLALLEKQNLEQQLEYLRYQINPHFLMNTLNNIHALVDIDAERAKEAIVDLSKIMRFVLYEGAKQQVPLSREIGFTQDYIRLMRMRLTDRVKVSVAIPERIPDKLIPPLILITFVENAFKHGVSYRQESFIDIAVGIDDGGLYFTCKNSKVPSGEDHHGGVGLQNVRRRLDLIYGDGYSLNIDDQTDTYSVELILPL